MCSSQLKLSHAKILDSSKMQEFAMNISNLMKMAVKFSKRFENTVGKGEMARFEQFLARFEQFLLFLHCFPKTVTADNVKTRACLGKD